MKSLYKILPKFLAVFFLSITLGYGAGFLVLEVEKNNKSLAAGVEEKVQTSEFKLIPSVNTKVTNIYEPIKPRDPRAISIQKYLRKQATNLADHSDLIIELSDKYKIDYKLVLAIAGLESGYCNKTSFANNCWGFGAYSWSSLETGIKEYYRLLSVNYFKKGMNTIEKLAPIYNSVNTQSFLDRYYIHYNLMINY